MDEKAALALFSQTILASVRSAMGRRTDRPAEGSALLQGLIRHRGPDAALVLRVLGQAARAHGAMLDYALPDFPGLTYRFTFCADGLLEDSGFVATATAYPLPQLPAEGPTSAFLAEVKRCEPALSELVAAYGPATMQGGWWPCQDWSFAPGWTIELLAGRVWASVP